jgi:hypothetical protein
MAANKIKTVHRIKPGTLTDGSVIFFACGKWCACDDMRYEGKITRDDSRVTCELCKSVMKDRY